MDPTEEIRRTLIEAGVPEETAAKATEKFDTKQLQEHFTVHGFLAPFVHVTRKSDNKKGTLVFVHSPRVYFGFQPE